jgi:hypothetical protein
MAENLDVLDTAFSEKTGDCGARRVQAYAIFRKIRRRVPSHRLVFRG